MNKLKYTLTGLLFFGLLFTGCKKEAEKVNYLQVSDGTFEITHGSLEYYGVSVNGYDIGMNLFTSGITVDGEGYWSNSGTVIWLEFISTASDGISSGSYVFSTSLAAFTIRNISYCVSWVSGSSSNEWVYLSSGNVSIVRNGNNYEINLKGIDSNGKVVKTNFTGDFEMYDFSSTKSATMHQ
jgi:hypothetical protein